MSSSFNFQVITSYGRLNDENEETTENAFIGDNNTFEHKHAIRHGVVADELPSSRGDIQERQADRKREMENGEKIEKITSSNPSILKLRCALRRMEKNVSHVIIIIINKEAKRILNTYFLEVASHRKRAKTALSFILFLTPCHSFLSLS